jgi:predicted  nucleic acid-binding Zn-ribbon protein
MRPKKHPRRTLSEQIIIPKLQDLIKSPKSPAPERVHRALQDRIDDLKDENANLKKECADQKDHITNLEDEREDERRDMADVKARILSLEREVTLLKEKELRG